MKIIAPSVELVNAPDYKTLLTTIEAAGRTCYKSEDKITNGSVEQKALKMAEWRVYEADTPQAAQLDQSCVQKRE